jgi:glucose-1-phosphate cytidylyltransferase
MVENGAPKVVILAGGRGSRLQEETGVRPKPMVEIGGKPILWHILNVYAFHGCEEFVLALGYKGEFIKEYFLSFYALNNDLTVDLKSGESNVHVRNYLPWRVHMVDTGAETQTGGRLQRLRHLVGDRTFMMTYCDGLADIDIRKLLAFHKAHGKLATVTAVRPPSRFGTLLMNNNGVDHVIEKPQIAEGWINGGFFVLEPGVFDYLDGDSCVWERRPMERLANDGQLMAFQHEGFWQPMDTLREKQILETLWSSGRAPWRFMVTSDESLSHR